MKKNTYISLALTACLSIISSPLFAEVSPAPEHPVTNAPASSVSEPNYPSELQREKVDHNMADMTVPETSVSEPSYPSEVQRVKAEHDKARAK